MDSRDTKQRPGTTLDDVPDEVLKKNLFERLALPDVATLALTSRRLNNCSEPMLRYYRFCQNALSDRQKKPADKLRTLLTRWQEFSALELDKASLIAVNFFNDTMDCLTIARPDIDMTDNHDQRQNSRIQLARLVADCLISHDCFDQDVLFISMLWLQRYFFERGAEDFFPNFQRLSPDCRARILALADWNREFKDNSTYGHLPCWQDWERACAALEPERSWRARRATALADEKLIPTIPGLEPNFRILEQFFSISAGCEQEHALNTTFLANYLWRIVRVRRIDNAALEKQMAWIAQRCARLPQQTDAALRYLALLCCTFAHEPDEREPRQRQRIRRQMEKRCQELPALPEEKVQMLLEVLKDTPGLKALLYIWVELYQELPPEQRFALCWNMDGHDLAMRKRGLLRQMMPILLELYAEMPEPDHARLFAKIGEFFYFDPPQFGPPDGLVDRQSMFSTLSAFAPENRQIALCGLSNMIVWATHTQAHYDAHTLLIEANRLPVEYREQIFLAILQAQQHRLDQGNNDIYQAIARAARRLPSAATQPIASALLACRNAQLAQVARDFGPLDQSTEESLDGH